MADLGTDFAGVLDLDWSMSPASGRVGLGQAIARRWLTMPGTLRDHQDYGAGLFAAMSGAQRAADAWAPRLENEALKDERIAAARVTVTADGEVLRVQGQLTDDAGPFDLTLLLSAAMPDAVQLIIGGVDSAIA